MDTEHLTGENFDGEFRRTLRYSHALEHDDLERVKGIITDAADHLKTEGHTNLGLSKEHLNRTLKFLNDKHHGWKALPEHKRAHIESALKAHFGVEE